MKDLGEMTVNYSATSDSLTFGGGGTSTGSDFTWDYYTDTWHPWHDENHHHYHYPYTTTYIQSKDKFKKAFRIAKLLLKKKLLNSRKLKDFIALVEEIAKEL